MVTSTEAQSSPERRRRLQPFASFRYRGYPWLWAANVTSGAVQGAQGFLVVWLVIVDLNLTYNALLFAAATALPLLLLGLPAGRFADRGDRRLLLMASHITVALVLMLTAVLTAADLMSSTLSVLAAALAVAGVAIGRPVRLALIPALVPRKRILNANALNELGLGLGAVGGIPMAGVVADQWGAGGAFAILAAISAVGALLLIPLRVPPRAPEPAEGEAAEARAQPATMRGDIVEGFRFLWSSTELRMLLALLLAAGLAGPWLALDLAAARERLDVSVPELGLLSVFLGVGTIVSTIALAFVSRVRSAGALFGAVIIVLVLAGIAVWFSSSYGLTGFLMGLYGLASGVYVLLSLALVQAHTPIAVMGRVMGIYVTLSAAAVLLSPQIARGGRALLQDEGWIVCSAIVLIGVVAMILWRNPGLRRMPSHPEPVQPVDEEATVAPGTG